MKLSNVKTVLVGSVLVASVGMTSAAFAGEHGKKCTHDSSAAGMHDRHERHLSKALSLTEEQQQTLKDQRQSQVEARQALREQTRKAEQALRTAVTAGASESELQSLADELGKLKATAALERAKSHKAFLAVLTPEQQQKLETLRSEHKGKVKSWRGKHREHSEAIDS